MLSFVQEFRWRDVKAAIGENPELIGFRDKKGRNWLHLCCSVNIKKRRVKAADSIKTAEIFLGVGLDINQEAFSEGEWKAIPLWYSIALGENLALSESLLKHGSDPNYCLWAAANRNDADAIRLLIHYGIPALRIRLRFSPRFNGISLPLRKNS